ncbi:TRAP transporter TatT component family protein [Alcanivorax sp. S6407]|uniref:TRAP transporter TatT component family protein n=1 Tax=Alcanivorax sp. S6407 TaxID=2926424 RepID=UPI001FF6C108|nr:TRAP transporter TatT component family protein [Alcanivorax sp. S6407]MCK0155127.1 TRAP transporter TatT component family protein [Alcanivorax sp. S6407]
MQWRFLKGLVPTVLLASAFTLQGCSLARVDDNLPYGVLNNNDLQLVEDGLPTYLLMVDGLIENWPESESLLASGADLYGAYAGLFVQEPERARKLSNKALDYAFRSACARDGDYCDLRGISVPEFEELLADASKNDVPMLFTLGGAWAGYIQQNTSDWNAVAELGRVEAIMDRVVELDEGYQYGQAHMYLGVLNSILPASLGGKPDVAKDHFEKAVALSEGKNLLAPVLYAEKYARLVFDRELHDRLLNEVLAADPDVHGLTLQNTYAQQEAEALLADADEYF